MATVLYGIDSVGLFYWRRTADRFKTDLFLKIVSFYGAEAYIIAVRENSRQEVGML